MFEDIKARISSIWTADESWSDRMAGRDYEAVRNYTILTGLIVKLAEKQEFSRAVEIGCGDARYSEFLRSKVPSIETWIATDIDGPRIDRAKREMHKVQVEAATIMDCINRYNDPGTLFFSANVFGNCAPDDMREFYSRLTKSGTGLAFLAGGLALEREDMFVVRPNGIAFDHNYFALTRLSGLSGLEYVVETYGDTTGTIAYWMAGHVA